MAIWHLSANYRGVNARGFINGYPIISADTAESGEAGFTSAPLNPFLVGKGNVLKVEITGRGKDAEFNARVEAFQPGDMVDSGGTGQISLDQLEHTFDTDEDHFSELLKQAQPATRDEMVAFALKLRDLLNGKKRKEALALFRPKMEALAGVFGVPVNAVTEQVEEVIGTMCKAKHQFDKADVNAQSCCDGKLWQLLDKQGNALIRMEDQDGGTFSMDITAAKLPQGILIVR
jgi:hypothetical protein